MLRLQKASLIGVEPGHRKMLQVFVVVTKGGQDKHSLNQGKGSIR